jgi:hypothetical protein
VIITGVSSRMNGDWGLVQCASTCIARDTALHTHTHTHTRKNWIGILITESRFQTLFPNAS